MDTTCDGTLTAREKEVLTLIAAGLPNKSIAEQLTLSPHTVAWYVQQIFSKLHVHRRTQAVAVARARGWLVSSSAQSQAPISSSQAHHDLPLQLTSFIGREAEIHEIITHLKDVRCHLLTLVGPGGIGKTRLALEAAIHLTHQFPDGIHFVALQPLTSPEDILPTIARALGVQFQADRRNALRQLVAYCRGKLMLLLMDNFEHVLDGGAIVSALLSAAPGVKVLATSRESLNLREEQLYYVNGLPFPSKNDCISLEAFSAVKLFTERSFQVYPYVRPPEALPNAVRICQLVEGNPLALELASSWVKTLSWAEIAAEIEHGLDILATPFHNVPERHQSMQVVFDYSWQLLSPEEQIAFRRLSVFRGGCTRDAAIKVTGTNRHVFQGLVDKSFIRRDPHSGRYDIHELLRQYGAAQLEQVPQEAASVVNLHCACYMELLACHRASVTNHEQLQMMKTLEPDLDNIRVAWRTAVASENVDAIDRALNTFVYFHVFRSRFLEEADALEFAIQRLDMANPEGQRGLLLAALRSYCGWIYVRTGDHEQAATMFEQSWQLYRDLGTPAPPGWASEPLTGLTLLASIHGDYEAAEDFGAQARAISAAQEDPWNLQLALYCSTSASFHQGKYDEARHYAEQALGISEESGDQWFRAAVLNDLGRIARVSGDCAQAKQHYRQSLMLRRLFDDAQGIAAALTHLGMIAQLEDDLTEAKRLYQDSYARYRDAGDRGGMGYALCGLGTTACARGEYSEARAHFRQALLIALDMQYALLTFAVLNGVSGLLVDDGRFELVIELLALTLSHHHSDDEARSQARGTLTNVQTDLRAKLGEKAYIAAWSRGESLRPEILVQMVLDAFDVE